MSLVATSFELVWSEPCNDLWPALQRRTQRKTFDCRGSSFLHHAAAMMRRQAPVLIVDTHAYRPPESLRVPPTEDLVELWRHERVRCVAAHGRGRVGALRAVCCQTSWRREHAAAHGNAHPTRTRSCWTTMRPTGQAAFSQGVGWAQAAPTYLWPSIRRIPAPSRVQVCVRCGASRTLPAALAAQAWVVQRLRSNTQCESSQSAPSRALCQLLAAHICGGCWLGPASSLSPIVIAIVGSISCKRSQLDLSWSRLSLFLILWRLAYEM
jgi:hypothetical protein